MTDEAANEVNRSARVQPKNHERITPEGVPFFYTNFSAFRTSITDITIDHGLLVEATEEKRVYRDVVTVVMSPQHARNFADVLEGNLKAYEDQFGPIPRSPDEDKDSNEPSDE
jgi:hypothetical protein